MLENIDWLAVDDNTFKTVGFILFVYSARCFQLVI